MAQLIEKEGTKITLQVTIDLSDSLLDSENKIQDGCNEIGNLATEEALKYLDTDGSPVKMGKIKWTSKGLVEQKYQTPYGEVMIPRHVYQTSKGGATYCPLEDKARIIRKATPRFAMQLSHKYTQENVQAVCRDLEENHHRKVSRSFVQNTVQWVGSIASMTEDMWEYDIPSLDEPVSSIVLSLDGAYILMRESGWREAMVGAISLYSPDGERVHSIYLGSAPEYGKADFKRRLEREIEKIKALYPDAIYLGIADGSKDNWNFLEKYTDRQLLDFYHVTEYLGKVAFAAYPQKTGKLKRKEWLSKRCKQLKHEPGTVEELISEMEHFSRKRSLTKTIKADLSKALTYFKNHRKMMNYPQQIQENLPIGSGVTEAACKTMVKQRLCCSGMRWKKQGAGMILSLRGLVQSGTRWTQFWSKINQYGTVIST